MTSPLLFRPARDDEVPNMLRLAGIDLFVLADLGEQDALACVLVRSVDDCDFEVCALGQRPDAADEGVQRRMLAGVADWLRARGARRLDDVDL